jgi:hypothetical protein
MTKKDFNSNYIRGFAILMAVGFVLIVGYIFLDKHFQSKEYPDLTFADSLVNERVSSFETNHAISYVDFGDGRKHTLDWGQNWNYEDYPTIISILSIGDFVSKKANSDTIVFAHSGKKYIYILGQMIERGK